MYHKIACFARMIDIAYRSSQTIGAIMPCKLSTLLLKSGAGAAAVSVSVALAALAQDSSKTLLVLVQPEGSTIELTRADLEALPQIEFETRTAWTVGAARYKGPRLADVLALADLNGIPVLAKAANDYKITLTPDLIGADYPIVAVRINDKPFGLREMGPLWIIYPYDSFARFRSELIFSASVWHLVSISPATD